MLPRLDPAGVRPVGHTEAVAGVEATAHARQQAGQPTLASLLGKAVQAQVLSRLGDGSFVVDVSGTPLRMALPAGTRAGAQLPMTLVSLEPQPTFTLPAARGQLVATVLPPALPAGAAPPPDGGEAHASLSGTARLLGAVLRTAASVPGAAARVGSEPLAGGARLDPAQLAQRLQHAITKSGLFYESHVAEWAEGKRSLPELASEPQMRKAPGSPLSDPESAQFVNLQLATQEQAQLAWHGQLGPGQPLDWTIGRDAPRREPGASDPAPDGWRSALRLRFALLGEIAATVVLREGQLQVELRPATEPTAQLLRAHAARLADGLDAAGTPLAALAIGAPRP